MNDKDNPPIFSEVVIVNVKAKYGGEGLVPNRNFYNLCSSITRMFNHIHTHMCFSEETSRKLDSALYMIWRTYSHYNNKDTTRGVLLEINNEHVILRYRNTDNVKTAGLGPDGMTVTVPILRNIAALVAGVESEWTVHEYGAK